VAETGTAMFGAINMTAPEGSLFITQCLWWVIITVLQTGFASFQ
jgi:TPP-dependent 2-oxoacid decarboxylase